MPPATKKLLQEYPLKFNPVEYNQLSLGSEIKDIKDWGPILWAPSIHQIKGHAKVLEWTLEIKFRDAVKYAENYDFANTVFGKEITESISKLHQDTVEIAFDGDMKPFATKIDDTKNNWMIVKDRIKWEEFDFANLADLYRSNIKTSRVVVWSVGDYVFQNQSGFLNDALLCIALGLYCDKYVPVRPLNHKNKIPLMKVSPSGFAVVAHFLHTIMHIERPTVLSKYGIEKAYEDFDKNNVIPLIPRTWHEDNIELLDAKKLIDITSKVRKRLTKNHKKIEEKENESKKSTPQNLADQDYDAELLKETIDHINRQIEADDWELENKDSVIKLSEILKDPGIRDDLWIKEYIVDTENGIKIIEKEILFAICAYGCLDILVEEDSMPRITFHDLARSIEQRYGIACKFYFTNDVGAFDMIERSVLLQ